MSAVPVVFEGLDCTGKTTLIERLKSRLTDVDVSWAALASGPPDPPDRCPFEEYEKRLYHWLYEVDDVDVLLLDRWHWGELVYGPVFRDGSRLPLSGFRHVEMFLRAHCGFVVFLERPTFEVVDCIRDRGDSMFDRDDVLETVQVLQQLYGDLLFDDGGRFTTLQTAVFYGPPSLESEDLILDRIVRMVNRNVPPSVSEAFRSYVGLPGADVILCGDRRGDDGASGFLSAFVPRGGSSGRYLLQALPDGWWRNVGILNAAEEDLDEAKFVFHDASFVALGSNAHDLLDRHGIPHGSVPHPQYVRRFLNSRSLDYGLLIQRAARTGDHYHSWKGEPL